MLKKVALIAVEVAGALWAFAFLLLAVIVFCSGLMDGARQDGSFVALFFASLLFLAVAAAGILAAYWAGRRSSVLDAGMVDVRRGFEVVKKHV